MERSSPKVYGDLELFNKPYLRVSWNITDLCQNKCWYCFNKKTGCQTKFLSKSQVTLVLKNLFGKKYTCYDFILLGGEPLLYPNLDFLLHRLFSEPRTRHVYVLTTKINNILFDTRIIPCITVHPQSSKDWNVSAISELVHRNSNTKVTLMLDPTCVDRTLELLTLLRDVIPNVITSHIRKPPSFEQYLDFPGFTTPDPITYKGLYCLHGMTSVKILGTTCFGAICNCFTKFSPNIIQCTSNTCNCVGNSHIIKTDSYSIAVDMMNHFIDRLK